MISIIKDLFSNQVGSAVILTIIGAITKKYIQFHRRDFFSRSSSEQIKAVEWLRSLFCTHLRSVSKGGTAVPPTVVRTA